MAGVIGMAVVCAGGIAFYVRFLAALMLECRRDKVGMFVRLDTIGGSNPAPGNQPPQNSTGLVA